MGLKIKNSKNIVTDGLVLALDSSDKISYPGSGGTWVDRIGSKPGTLGGGTTFSSSNGGIFLFDGTNEKCVFDTSAARSLIQNKTNISMGVWVNLQTLGSLKGLIGTLKYSCSKNLGLVASNSNLQFFNDTSTCVSPTISGVMVTNKWIYCVGTYDGTTTKVYSIKDGSLSSASSTVKSGSTNSFDDCAFVIYGANGSATHAYGSSAHVYNKTLTVAEITQNYNATKSRFGL
jgi:hypothetical protein